MLACGKMPVRRLATTPPDFNLAVDKPETGDNRHAIGYKWLFINNNRLENLGPTLVTGFRPVLSSS